MKTVFLSSAYLAPIEYYTKLLAYDKVFIEQHDHYMKQTYRNRCTIAVPDGELAGPIERNDIETVKKHIACMQNDDSDDVSLYKMLGTKLANIAEKKNPDKDYTQMMELLRG
jgi:predicted short-subunit dehydrogenase-like oxidoreductase (DUF2520 family)